MTTSDQNPIGADPVGSPRRGRVLAIVAAVVLVVALAVVAVFVFTGGAGANPVASPTSAPAEPVVEDPSPTPTATPPPSAVALPAECEDAFSPEYFALRTADTRNPLNDETVAGAWILEDEQLEALRAGLPHLTCTWAVASEEGILGSINEVTAAQSGEALLRLKEAGFECAPYRGGMACSMGLGVNEENGATIAGEEHFLRGNVWISTSWLRVHIEGYNDDIIGVLWGE